MPAPFRWAGTGLGGGGAPSDAALSWRDRTLTAAGAQDGVAIVTGESGPPEVSDPDAFRAALAPWVRRLATAGMFEKITVSMSAEEAQSFAGLLSALTDYIDEDALDAMADRLCQLERAAGRYMARAEAIDALKAFRDDDTSLPELVRPLVSRLEVAAFMGGSVSFSHEGARVLHALVRNLELHAFEQIPAKLAEIDARIHELHARHARHARRDKRKVILVRRRS
jgi:hypothetical protein